MARTGWITILAIMPNDANTTTTFRIAGGAIAHSSIAGIGARKIDFNIETKYR